MSEATEQAAFFEWATIAEPRIPELAFLAHWPNGEYRTVRTAVKLKAMGVKRGPLDCWLFARRGIHPGMAFEFKSKCGKLTDAQLEWGARLSGDGWKVDMFTNWQDAARAVCIYLGADYRQFGL